jgi:hypothetical protein
LTGLSLDLGRRKEILERAPPARLCYPHESQTPVIRGDRFDYITEARALNEDRYTVQPVEIITYLSDRNAKGDALVWKVD